MNLRKISYKVKSQKYEITNLNLKHTTTEVNEGGQIKEIPSHDTTEATYKSYPSNRRLNDEDNKQVLDMLDTGADSKKIAALMRTKTSKIITNKDLWNVQTKANQSKRK